MLSALVFSEGLGGHLPFKEAGESIKEVRKQQFFGLGFFSRVKDIKLGVRVGLKRKGFGWRLYPGKSGSVEEREGGESRRHHRPPC
jgi:hypothetical protein